MMLTYGIEHETMLGEDLLHTHIMTQKLADVLVKAHVQFCLTAQESPCGPIERNGISCAWAH